MLAIRRAPSQHPLAGGLACLPSRGSSHHRLLLPPALLAAPAADQEGHCTPRLPLPAERPSSWLRGGGGHLPRGCRPPWVQQPLLSCTPGKTPEEPCLMEEETEAGRQTERAQTLCRVGNIVCLCCPLDLNCNSWDGRTAFQTGSRCPRPPRRAATGGGGTGDWRRLARQLLEPELLGLPLGRLRQNLRLWRLSAEAALGSLNYLGRPGNLHCQQVPFKLVSPSPRAV